MKLTVDSLARMMDVSAVQAENTVDDIRQLAETTKKYNCVCAFVMPCYVPDLKEMLADAPEVGVGSVAGFPSGAHSVASKAAEARELSSRGADEIDMVINIGMLKSGRDEYVENDINAVVEAGGGLPVKVILETHHLTDEEIVRGSRISVRAGASYVKTGTGWPPTGATLHNVELIRSTVGDAAEVKASGGVRNLGTVCKMIQLGVSRFGVGMNSSVAILKELASMPGGGIEV